ncbi:MAG TPA: radical SAM protein [Vicinamibacterales bacterium]|nr:radical SAM protein [Vicinamibacterales bacterium]
MLTPRARPSLPTARPRVVLYNPRAVFFTMPLALVALASALNRREIDVVIIDGRLEADPVRAVVEASRGALCVGITVLTGAPIHDALAVSRAVKAAQPSCPVIWGGWHPSLFAGECLEEPSVDVVVKGQGEAAFRGIVEQLINGESPASVVSMPLRDLNEFPAHDYSLIAVDRYFALKGTRQVDFISSQGCRFRCAFCADPAVYERGWTGLRPERVVDEISALHHTYRMQDVAFQDETFFTHAARVDALAERLIQKRIPITWTATLRADQACRLGEELFAKVVRSGLRRVMVGVESGSQATLDRLHKDMKLEQVTKTAELCARHGVGAIFNFIVGFPGESEHSMKATMALAKDLRRWNADFETPIFYYRPYPGNPMAEVSAANGYQFPRGLEQWADFDYVGGRGPWLTAEQWRTVERFKFYSRHAWKPGAWRWPLRVTSRWRCRHDRYELPVEKLIADFVRPPQQVS